MKEGFRPFIMVNGLPSISVTDNGLTFSKAAVEKLGCPAYVKLYINDNEKILAIEASEDDASPAIPFYRENNRGIVSVRWNNKDLLNYLSGLMNWDLKTRTYKVSGVFDYNENVFEFDMKGAKSDIKETQNKDENIETVL